MNFSSAWWFMAELAVSQKYLDSNCLPAAFKRSF